MAAALKSFRRQQTNAIRCSMGQHAASEQIDRIHRQSLERPFQERPSLERPVYIGALLFF
jgi:hypothetical protein